MKEYCMALTFLAGIFAVTGAALSQETGKKKITMIEELMMPDWGGYELSYDGSLVAFTKTSLDTSDFESTSHVWLYETGGGDTRQLTYSEKGESNPRWLPDGRLLFNSERDGDEKVYVISPYGGEGAQFFDDDEAPLNGVFSPDHGRIAYTERSERADKDEWEKKVELKDDGYYWEHNEQFTHIWVYDIESKEKKKITSGDYNHSGPIWSPDGTRIAFSSNRTGTRTYLPGHSDNSEIWIVSSDSGDIRQLTNNPGPDTSPAWSPDGKWIAYTASENENIMFNQFEVMLIPVEGGRPVNLTADLDYSVSNVQWSKDSRFVYYSVRKAPTRRVFRSAIKDGKREVVLSADEYVTDSFKLSEDGRSLLFTGSSAAEPGEVFLTGSDSSTIRNILSPTGHMASYETARQEVVYWKGASGWDIDGMLIYPLDYNEGVRYPLILDVHGGPHGAYYNTYSAEAQRWAARGYAVLRANPRGSSGHTFEYGKGVYNDWGGNDFIDLMNGVDHVIGTGIADPERLGIMGGSYGGYMTFWTISQTDRFKAAIGSAAIADLFPFYGQTDIFHYFDNMFGVQPWEDPENYDRMSAARFSKNVTTPLLVVHGEEDLRVPITQGEEYYRFLKKMGKTVEFLRFPREGHGVDEPRHRLHLDREESKWMETYLKPVR